MRGINRSSSHGSALAALQKVEIGPKAKVGQLGLLHVNCGYCGRFYLRLVAELARVDIFPALLMELKYGLRLYKTKIDDDRRAGVGGKWRIEDQAAGI